MANTIVSVYPPAYNLQQIQFANINLAIEGRPPFPYINEVEYSVQVGVESGMGASPYTMGTTTGNVKCSGSLSVQLQARSQFMDLIKSLSPDGNSWSDAVFNLTVQWQAKVGPNQLQPPIMTDELFACRLVSLGIAGSSGPGMMVVKYALDIQLIRIDGALPVAGLLL